MNSSPQTTGRCVDQAIQSVLLNIAGSRERLIEMTQHLVRIPSETPPSDTRATAAAVMEMLARVPDAATTPHCGEPPIDNVVSILRADRPGKRLVLNGHLDTYPAGDHAAWSDDPFSAKLSDGKIFGRGACDMKGGIACALLVFDLLAGHRNVWNGELVLTLAGDEERMGELGTQYLLDTVPEARGDAMICADIGSPTVPRIGEKGMIWLDVSADGSPAHGAHVHRGRSAIDLLHEAMTRLATLRDHPVEMADQVTRTIEAAKPVSEPLGGDGEADVLQSITVNFGRIAGGLTGNLVADRAELNVDIRLPVGTSVAQIEAEIHRLLDPVDHIRFDITRRYEPSWTDPNDPIVSDVCAACEAVLGVEARPNGRIGGSDARLYRAVGIPTVVCGLTPYNLGGPDEYVMVDELVSVAKIQAHAALSFLSRP